MTDDQSEVHDSANVFPWEIFPYEITPTPELDPVKEPPVDMNPKHDRGLCAVCQTHNCWNCWNNPHNQISKTITATI